MLASNILARNSTCLHSTLKHTYRRAPSSSGGFQLPQSQCQQYSILSSSSSSTSHLTQPSRPPTTTNTSPSSQSKPTLTSLTKMSIPTHPQHRTIHSTPPLDPSPPLPGFQVPEHLFTSNPTPETLAGIIALLASTKAPWKLTHSPPGIQRTFTFKTFAAAMKFMNEVAEECKRQKHHPEWANVYNRVVVRWTTHVPRGISERDVYMAKWCDGCGARHGAVEMEGVVGVVGKGKEDVVTGTTTSASSAAGGGGSADASTPLPRPEDLARPITTSEIAYPGMPDNTPRHHQPSTTTTLTSDGNDDIVNSLLGPELEGDCAPCMTGKEKSKVTGTESGPGYVGVTPKDTSPRLESTAGRSVLEEMERKADTLGTGKR